MVITPIIDRGMSDEMLCHLRTRIAQGIQRMEALPSLTNPQQLSLEGHRLILDEVETEMTRRKEQTHHAS